MVLGQRALNFTACYGVTFTSDDLTKCPVGEVIQITTARFGRSERVKAAGLCPATPGDCSDNLTNHPDTLQLVRNSCDGKLTCDAFTIIETTTIICNGVHVIPDYGYFEYECVPAPPSELYVN